MAAKKQQAGFGYDPLAWMDGETPPDEQIVADDKDSTEDHTMENTAKSEEVNMQGVATEISADDAQQEKFNLHLEAVLNIKNVSGLYDQLGESLKFESIDIDASEVSSIDTSCLQLLVVFKQEAIKMHKQVQFDFPSEKFVEAANLLDISEMLEVNTPASGFF